MLHATAGQDGAIEVVNGWSDSNLQSSGHSSAVFTTVSRRNDIVASLFVQKGNTPLHVGALGGHVPVVRMLVENGASINAKSQVFTQRPAIFILHRCDENETL